MKKQEITLTYDFICPWCWIAERRLARVVDDLGLADAVDARIVPYELNPAMPVEGMDRNAYRTAKFGSWARSQAMDAHVAEAGRAEGLQFHYAIVDRTPNTLLAHRLVWFAQRNGNASGLVDALFGAYFRDGRDIGDAAVLIDIAAEAGLDADAVTAFLASDEGTTEIRALEAEAIRQGIGSVPSMQIGQTVITGAQPDAVFRDAFADAVGALAIIE
ncbi:DsbA family oxidoreductase [Burkholderia sp. Ac-20353]|uniref:DsbA family oxidoreductase n=1 Tax=Burkholderia sp. Ac-20353 TaxID=2703894 RepID=UPI00197C447A|nr:DsbA family oxidoreductase [Burkholderia sp. Ac-20353]MBN3787460.1 DsbA family oxidoreductase [Burkholderia sp. Ac-20353]